MGEKKNRREVMLSWELCDELMSDGRPFSASKTYTWSMNEKATLRQDLESWRGQAFTDDDFEGPNAFASIGKLMKGVTPPPLVNPIAHLALTKEGWNAGVFSNLSEKMGGG